eukprot:COSAG06_NODE_5234_length_3621_cov_4.128904_1_plen_209_part_00
MAAALAASMAVAHVQEIGIERSPLAPSERHVEPTPAPEPALIPSHRTPAAADAETASARDTRLGQVIAQRCVALREELAALGMGKLKERAAAEGLPAAEVERTLAAINGFSQAGGGKGGSESTAAAAQQALRERIVMHVAYKPADKRGKLGAHAMADIRLCSVVGPASVRDETNRTQHPQSRLFLFHSYTHTPGERRERESSHYVVNI